MRASGAGAAVESGDSDARARDGQVRRILLLEGCANAAVLLLKLVVGLATGSLAILGDAIHSLTDVANSAVAWFVVGLSTQPPDREHPYGHRKFETLAVFVLATFLTILAIELGLGALRREPRPILREGWAFALMIGVLVINISVALWEGRWARRLGSDILGADARHTFADVLTTVVVIIGWQVAARGYPWIDTLCALAVAALILYLAYGLFRRAIPVLVDQVAVAPEAVVRVVSEVRGVCSVLDVRSRWTGSTAAIDLSVSVSEDLTTAEAHEIADAIEREVARELAVSDVTVHIEPEVRPRSSPP